MSTAPARSFDASALTGQQKAGQVCTYSFDGVGNLRTMWEGGGLLDVPRTFTFDAADRLVTMIFGSDLTTFTWTGYGALETEKTGAATTSYTYSGQDQLIGVTESTGKLSTYTFDGDGLRRAAQNGNVKPTTMVWDGSDYLLLREPTTTRVVLTLDSEIVSCGTRDLLTDPLGTLVKEISAGPSLSSLFEFYPYGSPVVPAPILRTPFAYVAAYGYYNDTTDRDYVRARELSMRLGRWMQMDPLWPGQPSLRYVLRPTTDTDPTGMQVFGIKPSDFFIDPIQPPSLDDIANGLSCGCINKVRPCMNVSRAFGFSKGHDMTNALGHCMTACCIKRRHPECVWYWNMREAGAIFGHDASCMDEWNNGVGYGCAGGSESCYACCLANLSKLTWYEPSRHNWPPPRGGCTGSPREPGYGLPCHGKICPEGSHLNRINCECVWH